MADLGFDGKVAIVTGAAAAAAAARTLRPGGRIVNLGGSADGTGESASAAQKVVDEIVAAGGEAVADHNSVATPEGGEAIVQTALDNFETVDIVINNAGILRDKTFHNLTPELLEPVSGAPARCVLRHPAGVEDHAGATAAIVNTSSNSGLLGNFGQSNYGAAKMASSGSPVSGEASPRASRSAMRRSRTHRMTEDLLGPLGDKLGRRR